MDLCDVVDTSINFCISGHLSLAYFKNGNVFEKMYALQFNAILEN